MILSSRLHLNFKRIGVLPSRRINTTLRMSKFWSVDEVRSTFVEYFEKKHSHANYLSSPVVPLNDNTLLFTNSGMNQFKPIFVGTVDPSSPLASLSRAVNTQKCIRAGGKHNDLDDVGKDTYHHTFFEMLGTWSFGDYFKKEAIDWAYDILVNVYKLPVERLYASYFRGDADAGIPCDDEARELWLRYLPPERVLPFDKKANFWEMGDTGPCGPCSEIHFDRIGGRDAASLVNADDPNVIEIWNLVFMQFNREPTGELRQLPAKHIDTGMGLERLTSILQSKYSNYDTDVFTPIFEAIQKTIDCAPYTGKLAEEDAAQNFRDTAYRVVADHIRTLTFAITDGAVPSNEGRGYVLRRILRRAVRYGRQTLGAKSGFFSKLVPVVVEHMGTAFPELKQRAPFVQRILEEEESAFSALLDKGVKYFIEMTDDLKAQGKSVIRGDQAFYLYDTLGFPIDLTQIMASEKGFSVDMNGFQEQMQLQQSRSREATRNKRLAGRAQLALGTEEVANLQKSYKIKPTDDSAKYLWDAPVTTRVQAFLVPEGLADKITVGTDTFGVVLEATSFYAESGGQIGDSGEILVDVVRPDGSIGQTRLEVIDAQTSGGYILHICSPLEENWNEIIVGSHATVTVDYNKRKRVAPNHTMTHVLNFALREVIGADVDQKGSLVTEEKLRFDFSSTKALTSGELQRVEEIVNNIINAKSQVYTQTVSLKAAQSIKGLRAVFGEQYPDPVRVVSVGKDIASMLSGEDDGAGAQASVEFCGGTHVSNTGDASAFVVTEETAVARGIRRISAITGEAALESKSVAASWTSTVENLRHAAASAKEDGEMRAIEEKIAALRTELDTKGDNLVLGLLVKESIRSDLETAQRGLANERKKRVMDRAQQAIEAAIIEAKSKESSGAGAVVIPIKAGHDSKVLKKAMEDIRKAIPNTAFLCVSVSDDSLVGSAEDKVSCFAITPDGSALRADEWLASALASVGGKGGGRTNMAQGSVSGASNSDSVVKAASVFARSKILATPKYSGEFSSAQ